LISENFMSCKIQYSAIYPGQNLRIENDA
jgi:hypothetical protein